MKIHFISGLPRSGSSLLSNVLLQNPKLHVTPTSGLLDIMLRVRNQWDEVEAFKANPDNSARLRVLKGMITGFHDLSLKSGKIVFDKCRGWLYHLELVEQLLGCKVKVLVTVRDLRDVLASFEKLWRANPDRQLSQAKAHPIEFQTLEGRCKVWADASQVVGSSYNGIKDALQRGLRDRMHFVKYENFTNDPEQTLNNIYDFLEIKRFKHDFKYVEQKINENDELGYGIPDLHTIRNIIEPAKPQYPQILGEVAKLYENNELW